MANITSGATVYGLSTFSNPKTPPFFSAGSPSLNLKVYGIGDLSSSIKQPPRITSQSWTAAAPAYARNTYSVVAASGNYKITGRVEINTVVVSGKWVYLFPEQSPGLCIGALYTDTNGVFTFNYLAPGSYKVYAMDPNFNYNGKLYENIAAVPM